MAKGERGKREGRGDGEKCRRRGGGEGREGEKLDLVGFIH